MTSDDRILITRILKQNDQRAYSELVNRYQSRLRYSLRQLTGWDEALADDLAQDTFIKAFKNLGSFKGESQFYTWLYRIAYREFASYKRALKPVAPLPEILTEILPDTHHANPMTDVNTHRDLAHALAQLPYEQAASLHLHLHCEFTQQEVADIMGAPLGSVKSHLLRGKNTLRVLLSSWQTNASDKGAKQA